MPTNQNELEKKIACVCMQLPCVHNPMLSDDIKTEVKFIGQKNSKGSIYLFIEKNKFKVLEETPDIMKVLILE